MNRQDRRAQRSKTDAGSITPAAQCEAGHRHMTSGQPLEAQLCCQHVLATDPNHAGALHLMGLIAFNAGQYDHSLE
jgi:Tfp pilus assembly protein PilF